MPQHMQGGNLVAQDRVSLSNFVNALGITHATLFNLAFGSPQEFQSAGVVMPNRIAEGLAHIRGKERRVPFKRAVKVVGCLLAIVHVVLGKTVVEEDVNRIVDRQALQKLVIFAQIEIAVQRSAIYFDQGIVLARFFALRHGFLQHPSESVSISKLPVRLCAIGAILQD